ncbi:MAG: winged helix-turn-helix transcriptional regulator [Candidatus Methanoperedens sp.]|nr:winged helix-turn-helix transcriptional regulator [Candidatus Methanoperedens sp.]
MPENEKNPGEEKLLILPLGDASKKITQVISNDTARQIIELLADTPLSASDIAQSLHVPLTTIAYNLENLENVGLIKVEKIKYSEKGREVKIYAPVRKLIILVPEKTDRNSVGDILRKYLGIILAAVFASSIIEFFMRSAGRNAGDLLITNELKSQPVPPAIQDLSNTSMPVSIINETVKSGEAGRAVPSINAWDANATAAVPVQPPSVDNGAISRAAPDIFTNLANAINAHPGFVFLLGCLFVVAILVIMDYRKKRKKS